MSSSSWFCCTIAVKPWACVRWIHVTYPPIRGLTILRMVLYTGDNKETTP